MNHESVGAWIANTISVAAVLGALWGVIPVLAAFAALIWYVIQIYESRRVQHWLKMRRAQRLADMRAQVEVLERQLREHTDEAAHD